jgi:hypothetical protein
MFLLLVAAGSICFLLGDAGFGCHKSKGFELMFHIG